MRPTSNGLSNRTYSGDAGGPECILREARTHAGLSRRELARKAGVPTSTVSRIEEGQSDPTLGMLARLIDAAGSDLIVEAPATGRSLESC